MNSACETPATLPSWRRVAELADLVEIFDPGVQVCAWERTIDPAIDDYLARPGQPGQLQALETLAADVQPRLPFLPDGPGRSLLIDDVALLRDVVCELLGCREVGLRFARIGHAMCPGWHVDRTGIRLVCTYRGPGTEWLDDQTARRQDLQSDRLNGLPHIQASTGDIVLLKGSLWQDNAAFGAIHRSPDPIAVASLRALITLDPIWRD